MTHVSIACTTKRACEEKKRSDAIYHLIFLFFSFFFSFLFFSLASL
jgi:hypothetical protein